MSSQCRGKDECLLRNSTFLQRPICRIYIGRNVTSVLKVKYSVKCILYIFVLISSCFLFLHAFYFYTSFFITLPTCYLFIFLTFHSLGSGLYFLPFCSVLPNFFLSFIFPSRLLNVQVHCGSTTASFFPQWNDDRKVPSVRRKPGPLSCHLLAFYCWKTRFFLDV